MRDKPDKDAFTPDDRRRNAAGRGEDVAKPGGKDERIDEPGIGSPAREGGLLKSGLRKPDDAPSKDASRGAAEDAEAAKER